MIFAALALLAFVALSATIQGSIVAAFVRRLYSSKPRVRRTTNLPKAAVVLSIRGADPVLESNLSAVLQQDYPQFTLFIVIDSVEDPAWPVVQRIYESAPDRVDLQVLRNPLPTCSLKCSSLAQVVEGLDPSYEVVAFMDGDVFPHEDWLRDLVAPLADKSVGVATGNRWYLPKLGEWGSLVRYFWNTGAIVQVWLNDMVWGGSMAMRRDVMLEVGMPAAMRKGFADDTTVVRQMKAYGYKTRFVPAVMMANREEITLASFVSWSERQMVCAKLCGSNFRMVNLHAFNIFCCMFLPFACLIAGWHAGNSQVVLISLAAIATFWLAAAFSTFAVELGVRHVLSVNQSESQWLNVRTIARLLPALIMAHLVYFRILIGTYTRKCFSWRGVNYEIRGANEIRLLAYQPFQESNDRKMMESVV